jgi:aspartyl-tRNA synthetase
LERGFIEIRTPTLVAEATEGGSEVFEVKYFDRKAYLAQSPQLYKQLALVGGLDKVFMIVPVFRAEKSNTTAHLTEVTQMDIEVAFADADDVIKLLAEAVTSMVKEVIKSNKEELELLGRKLEVPKVKVVSYTEAVAELKKKGSTIEFGVDFSREDEQKVSEIYGKYVIVKEYPTKTRAFYSMPKKDNPEISYGFDFIFDGLEICSGAQRIHLPELLTKQIEGRGLDPKNFEFYINAFRNGAPPHAGWSIGLERLTMQIAGLKNIREAALFPRDRKRITP